MSQEDRSFNRRRFFRDGLKELLRPLVKAVEPLTKAAEHINAMDAPPPAAYPAAPLPVPAAAAVPRRAPSPYDPPPIPLLILRPPGAMREEQFQHTCSRCGDCVRVCPAQCIKIDPTAEKGGALPYIEANSMPCVVCSELSCMAACPTGALLPVPALDIDMGTAEWKPETCVRGKGEDCTICVDQCPLSCDAIELRDGLIHVIEEGCVGCGVCQYYCPTSPKSIVVIPKAMR